MSDLRADLVTHLTLRERLLVTFPQLRDDEQALADTLEGCSNLNDAIVAVILSSEEDRTMVAAISTRIAELTERMDRLDGRVEKKRELVCAIMDQAGLRKIEAPEFTVSLARGSARVVVTDEALLPTSLLVPQPAKPDRKAIGDALKAGTIVPGAELSNPHPHITVRRT